MRSGCRSRPAPQSRSWPTPAHCWEASVACVMLFTSATPKTAALLDKKKWRRRETNPRPKSLSRSVYKLSPWNLLPAGPRGPSR